MPKTKKQIEKPKKKVKAETQVEDVAYPIEEAKAPEVKVQRFHRRKGQ